MGTREPVTATVTVLSVSRQTEDHLALMRVLAGGDGEYRWEVAAAASVDLAMSLLQQSRIPVVVCESELGRENWKTLVERLPQLAQPPFLIVRSHAPDDSLWAEALNLCAYDVLAKPLVPAEVMRTLTMAWLRWERAHLDRAATAPAAAVA